MSLVLQCLSRSPPESLKLAPDKHLTWKMPSLLALASAKRVSFCVRHLHDWSSCTFSFFPEFMAKTQNPSVPDSHFKEFSVPSLDDYVGGDWD